MSAPGASDSSIHNLLTRDHARLERLFDELLEAVRTDSAEDLSRVWTSIEEGVTAHLAAEEDFVLPSFEEVDPSETEVLRAEHRQIRKGLAGLAAAIRGGTLDEGSITALVGVLRAHGRREDGLFYPWIDRQPDAGAQLTLRRRLYSRATKPLKRP